MYGKYALTQKLNEKNRKGESSYSPQKYGKGLETQHTEAKTEDGRVLQHHSWGWTLAV